MKITAIIKRIINGIATSSGLILFAAAGAFGQTALMADAHTSTTSVNGNYGTNPTVTVSANNAGYFKFNVLSFLPAGTKAENITNATIKLYVSKVTTPGKLDLYPVLSDWDEKTITANTAPQVGAVILKTQQIGKDNQGNYLLIDVTELVKQWVGDGTPQNALPNYGFALAPHPVDYNTPQIADINLDSKENSQTSHDAALSVQLKDLSEALQTVATDTTLTGDGTQNNPLGVAPNAISNAYLADGAVTTSKIADSSVVSSKLADNSVTNGKIADNSVGGTKLQVPLSLSSADAGFTLAVANTGGGAALTASGAINTSAQYNIGDARVLSNPGVNNLFAGVGAGAINSGNNNSFIGKDAGTSNSVGKFNSFFGSSAGRSNTGGDNNSFFGSSAGQSNTTGFQNSFYGREAGLNNTEGSFNSFFGRSTGLNNTLGSGNSFFGQDAGLLNITGSQNTFFGNASGSANTTGGGNAFFGTFAGDQNKTGGLNTALGWGANFGANNLTNASAIGAGAFVSKSNALVLGGISGINSGTDTNVGIGTTAPRTKLQITNGKIYIEANGQGMILKSPNGSCFEMTVTDAGTLAAAPVVCP